MPRSQSNEGKGKTKVRKHHRFEHGVVKRHMPTAERSRINETLHRMSGGELGMSLSQQRRSARAVVRVNEYLRGKPDSILPQNQVQQAPQPTQRVPPSANNGHHTRGIDCRPGAQRSPEAEAIYQRACEIAHRQRTEAAEKASRPQKRPLCRG